MTKECDKRFRHVGRIKRSWGTTHKPTIRRMEEMMSGLFERGRLDILRLIQDGTYSPLQVYDAYRTNELERLPTAATLAPLREAMEKWIAKKECSESHRRSLMQSMRHVIAGKPSRSYVIGDIPALLMSLRERMQGKHPRSFNLARAAAQAFAKTTAGRNSKLWSDISQVEVLRVTPQRKGHPMTPTELIRAIGGMAAPFRMAAWTMAATGMGPTEYWSNEWDVLEDRVWIRGTKRAGRDRIVPKFLTSYAAPSGNYKAFRKALGLWSGGRVRPYDFRRTFANWMEAAGIPRIRRITYMGHGAKDTTDRYEMHEVTDYLESDAAKLRGYVFGNSVLSATENTGLRLEKA